MLKIWCTKCGRESSAEKVRQAARRPRRARWLNRCCSCGTFYDAPPPTAQRVAARAHRELEERYGQLRLVG